MSRMLSSFSGFLRRLVRTPTEYRELPLLRINRTLFIVNNLLYSYIATTGFLIIVLLIMKNFILETCFQGDTYILIIFVSTVLLLTAVFHMIVLHAKFLLLLKLITDHRFELDFSNNSLSLVDNSFPLNRSSNLPPPYEATEYAFDGTEPPPTYFCIDDDDFLPPGVTCDSNISNRSRSTTVNNSSVNLYSPGND